MSKQLKIQQLFLIQHRSVPEIAEELNIAEEIVEHELRHVKHTKKSNIENIVGKALKEIYPGYKIIAQKNIDNLYIDYYIEPLRLAIEVDGIQHTKIIPFFHGKSAIRQHYVFDRQISNDKKKEILARNNYIYLIRISYKDNLSVDNIRTILNEHHQHIIDNLSTYASRSRVFE